jgi:hypothetical protein
MTQPRRSRRHVRELMARHNLLHDAQSGATLLPALMLIYER